MAHSSHNGGAGKGSPAFSTPAPARRLPQLADESLRPQPPAGEISAVAGSQRFLNGKFSRVIHGLVLAIFLFSTPLSPTDPRLFSPGLAIALAAEEIEVRPPPDLVKAETLQAKIDEVETSTDFTAEEKNELLELYKKALSNLQAIRSNLEATESFRRETQAAPKQIESLKGDTSAIERQRQTPMAGIQLEPAADVEKLVQLLQSQQAELAAADVARTDLARRLSYMNSRPVVISERLAEAEREQEAMEAGLKAPAEGGSGELDVARRWVFETGYMALSTEIGMLEEELLRKPIRTSLLEARLKYQDSKLELIKLRVSMINDRLNKKRQLEAEKVQHEAEKVQKQAEGGNPVVVKLSAENAELSKQIKSMAAQLEQIAKGYDQAMKLNSRVTANFQDAQDTLESSGLTEGLGKVLLAQRSYLPELEVKKGEARERDQQIAEAEVMRLKLQAEARRMADTETFISQFIDEERAEQSAELLSELRPQIELRKQLLDRAMDMLEVYLTELNQLNREERKLLASVSAYQTFLQQNLLWLRNAEPTKPGDFLELPMELGELFRIATQPSFVTALKTHLVKKPLFWLTVIFALFLVLKRRKFIKEIKNRAKIVGKPVTDNIANTLITFVLTALWAAPTPLVLAMIGWLLESGGKHELTTGLGKSLMAISLYYFSLRFYRAVCMPRGLAEAHFRWPEDSLRFLRKELDRFFFIIIPSGLAIVIAISLSPGNDGGIFARLCFVIAHLSLVIFFYRIFHPDQGVLAHLREQESSTWILKLYPVLFFTLILFPIVLIILVFSGYLYSVGVVSNMFGHTWLLLFGLILLNALLLRWIEVVRRKIYYEALMEKKRQRLEEPQTTDAGGSDEESAMQFEEPEVDVAGLAGETREFVTLAVFLAGLLGLYLVWSSFLPALKILDEVVLWHNNVKEGGIEKQLPITLADLGLAIIYAGGVAILAKRLPALLEIILLRGTNMTSGARYTVTSLANYTIITVGVVLVLNSLGAQWSQLQWLVAALGVGIGFGLQEIIANFICGLIILFEQPVRVGDIVTIGDTDGVVTKIRMRATTIRNWDRKELLVPNKEFITGRLLNWSLADQVTRIYIVIGIAYGSDVDKAMELIRQAAEQQEHVLEDPPPHVNFEGFGDNSLNLTLRAYVDNIDFRLSTITEIHREVNRLFAEAAITIPFPQRDVHFDCRQPLRIRIEEQP